MSGQTIPPFPAPHGPALAAPAALEARGIALRPAGTRDLPHLRRIYRETRADEFAGLAWTDAMRDAFIDQQFLSQHLHYVREFANAEFLIVEQHHRPIGRLYLLRAPPAHHLIDISLEKASQRQGIGTALLAHVQDDARMHGQDLRLHVRSDNTDAARLYRRHGFAETEDLGAYRRMQWACVS